MLGSLVQVCLSDSVSRGSAVVEKGTCTQEWVSIIVAVRRLSVTTEVESG